MDSERCKPVFTTEETLATLDRDLHYLVLVQQIQSKGILQALLGFMLSI